MAMTYSHAKVKGQQSVGPEDRVETNGRTEAIALPPTLMRSVNKWTDGGDWSVSMRDCEKQSYTDVDVTPTFDAVDALASLGGTAHE